MHDHVVTRVRRRWPAPLLGAMGSLAVAFARLVNSASSRPAAIVLDRDLEDVTEIAVDGNRP